jgi:hypothetical protein
LRSKASSSSGARVSDKGEHSFSRAFEESSDVLMGRILDRGGVPQAGSTEGEET